MSMNYFNFLEIEGYDPEEDNYIKFVKQSSEKNREEGQSDRQANPTKKSVIMQ